MFGGVSHISIFVTDQEKALAFYTKLGFIVHTDERFGTMRWLTLCLPQQRTFEVALLKAETDQEKALVGKQAAEKPLMNLETDNCHADYERLSKEGVFFFEKPKEEPWGISAAFKDLEGNILYMCQSLH